MDTNESVYKSQLYSRQIGTLGETCMKQLSTCKVLLLQLDTTGFEIAKCLVLTGIQQIYLYDPRIPTSADIGLNIPFKKTLKNQLPNNQKNI
jgi:molybdopterin/thiamine biosynthesis adenylyltransferase